MVAESLLMCCFKIVWFTDRHPQAAAGQAGGRATHRHFRGEYTLVLSVVFRMACLLPLLSVPAKSFKPGLHIIDVMQDEDRVWIVTELCSGGDLEHFIKVRDLMICEVGGAHRCALSASWKLAHTPEPVLSGVPLLAGLRAHDRTRGCACST